MNQIQFTLTTPVKYSHKGEDTDGTFITLTEPTIKQLKYVAAFKKAFYQSAEKASSGADTDQVKDNGNKEKVTSEVIMTLLYAHYPDMEQLFNIAKKLFFSIGVAQVEGDTDFNQTIYDTMTIVDFENMLGEYLVNFILQSALSQGS